MQVEVKPIDLSAIKQEELASAVMLSECKTITIVDQESYNCAAEILAKIKGRLKWLEENRKSLKQPILEAGRRIDDFFRVPMDGYSQAKNILDAGLLTFEADEERKRLEMEAKLRREAEKKRAELEAKAEKAREEGKEAKAEKYEEKANNVIEPVLAPTIEKPKGFYSYKKWYAEVVDFAKLDDIYKIANMSMLDGIAEKTHGLQKIKGVTFKYKMIAVNKMASRSEI
jgi:hypothetical protein